MSEYQQDRKILDGKAISKTDRNINCLELGKALKADLEEGHIYSIIEESGSFRNKPGLPSLTPPPSPPPRPAKPQVRKYKSKESKGSDQYSPQQSESIKRFNEGNIDQVKKVDLTQQEATVKNDVKITKPSTSNTKRTTKSKKNKKVNNTRSNPTLNVDFERNNHIQDANVEDEKIEEKTKNKEFDYVGPKNDNIQPNDQIYYLPMCSINKETAKKVDIESNDSLSRDPGKAKNDIDENEYEIMGNSGTKTLVISPTFKRKEKTTYVRSLSKHELVNYLEKCGLHNLAAVCVKEKLDGHFLEKYVNDEDLMLEPFFLTHFQIKKLRAILGGWRPISEYPTDIDGLNL